MLERIRKLIDEGSYDVKMHARKKMIDRKIKISEVKEAIENSTIIEEYLDDKPLPTCLLYGDTLKQRPIHVVIALDEEVAAIITVYEPDTDKWIEFKRRR
jgi:hypothetical protein